MIRLTKDGRTILSGKHYTAFRHELWESQEKLCFRCGRRTELTAELYQANSFHVHHTAGRGMGGGKRSDTFAACQGLCGGCHRKEHNQ